jgi:hypothetical protein
METKALVCNVIPGRRPRGAAFLPWLNKYAPQGGPPVLHPEQPPPGAPPGGKLTPGHGQHGKSV